MLYYFKRNKLSRHLLVGGALFAAGLGMFSCSDSYDLDDNQPTGAGGVALNSLYGYIEDQGNCNTYLQLIKDMGLDEILSKTGSMTMFVADDDAYAEFFKSNKWGVHSYSDLSLAQKKMLLNCSMIGNPLTTTMLSNATANGDGAVTRGEVCRRKTQLDILDSVQIIKGDGPVLPDNEFLIPFKRAHAGQDIVLFTDSIDPAPMVHFTAKYITSNKIEYSDIDFVMNDKDQTLASDPREFLIVNGARVDNIADDANIFCKNGFIHKVNSVIVPLENMAEIIRNDENSSTYSSILERFASVKYDKALTERYNYSYGTDYDSVYIKRYFSTRTAGSSVSKDTPFKTDVNGRTCSGSLKFDPGWNSYVPAIFNDRDPMMEDLAVMLVPTDAAMSKWWNEGGGKVIKDFYGTLENTPLSTLEKLVNVNMIESFNSAVPSRFNSVLNDANEPLGLSADSIDRVTLGCNGVIYHTNTVYAPASYSSVLFPAIVDTAQFNIINLAIHQLDYDKYLNSMVSQYSFFLPTNKAIASYVDPCSFPLGSDNGRMFEFKYDEKKKNIHAEIFKCQLVDGKWVKGESTGNYIGGKPGQAIGCKGQSQNTGGDRYMTNRVEDMLNNCIVIEPMREGKKFYKTKGNSYVKVEGYKANGSEDELRASMGVYGSGEAERESPINVKQVYKMNNGQTFVVDNGALSGAQKTVAGTLAEIPEFNEFYRVMQLSGCVMKKNTKDSWYSASANDETGNLLVIKTYGQVGAEDIPSGKTDKDSKATYLLNNYHYTVYAPTNEAMEKAYAMGLPRPEQIEEWEEESAATDDPALKTSLDSLVACKKEALLDFVKYHIQDNSVFVDEGFETGNYESAKTELIQASADEETGTDAGDKWTPGRPYKIQVTSVSSNGMTVKDNIGETHNVVTSLSNIMAREYWIARINKDTGIPESTTSDKDMSSPETLGIASSSFVVIQGIDGPLVYSKDQFEYKYRPIYQEK